MNKGLGWQPDLRDERDALFSALGVAGFTAGEFFTMQDNMPPVYDQKSLGSCTWQSLAAALQYTEKEILGWVKRPVPARLFGYYNTRQLQGTVNSDSGATIRNSVKAAARWGYCAETPTLGTMYNIKLFDQQPSPAAYRAAAKHRLATVMYARVGNPRTGEATVAQIKAAVGERNPVTFGFTVYSSFDKAGKTGVCPMPMRGEDVEGGHAVLIVGWDDSKQAWICRNSWGARWGNEGYFYMPYDFQLQYAQDFWVIKLVPTPEQEAA